MSITLWNGECLALMGFIPDQSVDMVLCDLPYGTTQNKWDTCIDLTALWAAYRRVCKPNAAIVLTAAQPFTSVLVCSNLREFRHHWIWEKTLPSGHLFAKKKPMMAHEDVLVFSGNLYNPQITEGHPRKQALKKRKVENNRSECYGKDSSPPPEYDSTKRYPRSVQVFAKDRGLHPTQKPVALMEYLIRTYTDPGMVVLDNCMGSGTTGVACMNTGRSFIGIEQDKEYFKIAEARCTSI